MLDRRINYARVQCVLLVSHSLVDIDGAVDTSWASAHMRGRHSGTCRHGGFSNLAIKAIGCVNARGDWRQTLVLAISSRPFQARPILTNLIRSWDID